MSLFVIILIFAVFRLTNLFIAYIAPHFIPYLGFFPYKEILDNYNTPQFLRAFANFDGVHYLLIAKNGYSTYEQAFFPLYPLLIKFLWSIFDKSSYFFGLTVSLISSNIFFLIGLYFLNKYLKVVYKQKFSFLFSPIFYLVLFPTSFFFGAVYTEGLFFFLFIAVLYFLKKEKYVYVTVFALLASLTKFIGVFLIIPILFHFFSKKNWLRSKTQPEGKLRIARLSARQDNWKLVVSVLSPLLGLGLYSFYLWRTNGDPIFFLNSQWAFGAHRSSSLILLPQVYFRYLKIFFIADWNFQYFVSLFEFVTFNFVFAILILDLIKILKTKLKNFDTLGINLFSFANLLLPTLTGTLSSVPRYALFSLSFFLFLAQIKSIKIKIVVALIFAIFHIIMLSFFVQGYFVS